jgi:DNA polymerase-3 subunit gamma/tau
LIAKKSEGSMRDSQSLLDQVVSFCGTAVTVTELSELLGIIDTELFFEFTACVARRDVLGGLQLVERIFHQGCDIAEFLNGLTEHFRNMLVLKTTNNAELIEGLESYAPRYQEAAKSFSEYDLLRFIKMSSETANGVKRAANPKMMLELLLVKMIKMEKSVELDELLNQLQGIKPTPKSSTGGSGPATHLASYSALPTEGNPIIQANPIIKDKTDPGQSLDKSNDGPNGVQKLTDVSLTQIKEKWADIIGEVKGKRIHLGSFLNEGYPTDLQNGVLEISFGKENGFHINALNQNKMLIENAILIQTGFKLRVQCKKNERADFKEILLNHRPVVAEAAKTIDEESMRQSPIVQKVIEVFDGEIVG